LVVVKVDLTVWVSPSTVMLRLPTMLNVRLLMLLLLLLLKINGRLLMLALPPTGELAWMATVQLRAQSTPRMMR